jgi:hypothetical protein
MQRACIGGKQTRLSVQGILAKITPIVPGLHHV